MGYELRTLDGASHRDNRDEAESHGKQGSRMFLEGAVRRVLAPRKALWEQNPLSSHKSPHDRGHEGNLELGVYYE